MLSIRSTLSNGHDKNAISGVRQVDARRLLRFYAGREGCRASVWVEAMRLHPQPRW